MLRANEILALQNESFKFIGVRFKHQDGGRSEKVYHYKTTLELEEGDEVVVDSPFNGMVVVEVVKVIDFSEIEDVNAYNGFKWVVSKVDRTEYDALIEKERTLVKELRAMHTKQKLQETAKLAKEYYGEEAVGQLESIARL